MPTIYEADRYDPNSSLEVQDMIGSVPHWIVRWGLFCFFAVLLICVCILSVVRYPEILLVEGQIITKPATGIVVWDNSSGGLATVLVDNGQTVSKNQMLLNMKDTTSGASRVLTSPCRGTVSVRSSENGELLISVMPTGPLIISHILLKGQYLDKIRVGDPVVLELNDYPSGEFGTFSGKIRKIDGESHDGNFKVGVQLDQGLTSDFGKTIPLQRVYGARATLQMNSYSVLERVFKKM